MWADQLTERDSCPSETEERAPLLLRAAFTFKVRFKVCLCFIQLVDDFIHVCLQVNQQWHKNHRGNGGLVPL